MLSNEEIKQIFFYCDNDSSDGLFADEVDIIEFGEKVALVAAMQAAQKERQACIEFVRSLNTEVAKALEEKRGK